MAFIPHHSSSLFLLFVSVIFLLSGSVTSKDAEDNLFWGINGYRMALNLSSLSNNDNAHCAAKKISKELEDRACSDTTVCPHTQLSTYSDRLKCDINPNATTAGIVLQACVPDLKTDLMLSNFMQAKHMRYFNSTKYTGVGIGSHNDWMVVVLSTSTPNGSLTKTSEASVIIRPHHYLVSVLMMGSSFLLATIN